MMGNDDPRVEVGDIVIVETYRGARPAIVTAVWNDDCVNVTMFKDGTYDGYADEDMASEPFTSLMHHSTMPPNSVLTWRTKDEARTTAPVE